jgi:hypothetical protein
VDSSSCTTSDWKAFRALRGPEKRIFVSAALLLPVATLLLRVIGWRRLEWVGTRLTGSRSRAVSSLDAAAVDHLVRAAAARSRPPSTCLSRSLTLSFLLRRQGIENELCIGVRRDDGQFEAHAWVEHLGQPVNEAQDIRAHFSTIHRS